jgi:hypothetical protein
MGVGGINLPAQPKILVEKLDFVLYSYKKSSELFAP